MKPLANTGVKVLLKDRSLNSSRPLISTLFEESGDTIQGTQDRTHQTFKLIYGITLRRVILHEENTNTKCSNYPTEKYLSYKDCDDAFIYKSSHSDPSRIIVTAEGKGLINYRR